MEGDIHPMLIYRSPYEAYPFLADAAEDLRCDFELLTDEMSSLTGLLCAQTDSRERKEELIKIDTLIYHVNPALRTSMTVTGEEIEWLKQRTEELQQEAKETVHRFVLPQGGTRACTAHILRVKAKELVRLIYRFVYQGNEVPSSLLDFCNLLSGYFFGLALLFNREQGMEEIDFVSRNY